MKTVRREIEQAAAGHRIADFLESRSAARGAAIFDRTFAITYALEAVAVIVAVMGVAGALLALVIDRRREFGLLRFLGAASGQIRKLILVEAGLLGLLAMFAGVALGIRAVADFDFCHQQAVVWLDDSISLAGRGSAWRADASFMWRRCSPDLYPANVAMRLNPIEVVHEE